MIWVASCALGIAAVGAAGFVWLTSLPRLDPTGREDSAPAVLAMIEGRAVRNVASGWPVTKTGWPFFERYSPKDPD